MDDPKKKLQEGINHYFAANTAMKKEAEKIREEKLKKDQERTDQSIPSPQPLPNK